MTPEGRPAKVLLAMSGGVDSSVAAALLAQAGHEVVGCFMRLGTVDEPEGMRPAEDATACGTTSPRRRGCCSVGDAEDARLVAARLGIPLYVLNFRRDFDRVIDYFVGEYAAGRTPNPCVRCNDWLKFGRLHDHAESIGASFVASGHYARIERRGDEARLRRGLDEAKDQSYVLFGLPGERLRRTLLPIGGLRKPEVRRLARELELPVFDKPDSQEICFVPDGDYAGLLRRRAPDSVAPGRLVDEEGRTLGEHPGHQHFTVVHSLVRLSLDARKSATVSRDPGRIALAHLDQHSAEGVSAGLVVCGVARGLGGPSELVRRQATDRLRVARLPHRELVDVLCRQRPRAAAALHRDAGAACLQRDVVTAGRLDDGKQTIVMYQKWFTHFADLGVDLHLQVGAGNEPVADADVLQDRLRRTTDDSTANSLQRGQQVSSGKGDCRTSGSPRLRSGRGHGQNPFCCGPR